MAGADRAKRVGTDTFGHFQAGQLDAQKKCWVYAEALSEKHAPTRAQFGEEVSHIAPSKRVYVDQCGLDNTLVCAYGWSPKGKRCPGIRLGHKTARVSVMAALCQGQLIAPLTFTGSCDAALVEAWMEQHLLPLLSEGQVVILDNASFHRKAPLRALLATKNCTLLPLPPYSPDLNDIEHHWSPLKQRVARDQNIYPCFHDKVDAAFL